MTNQANVTKLVWKCLVVVVMGWWGGGGVIYYSYTRLLSVILHLPSAGIVFPGWMNKCGFKRSSWTRWWSAGLRSSGLCLTDGTWKLRGGGAAAALTASAAPQGRA